MAIPKKDLMKRLRDERRAEGLVKVDVWVMPENRELVKRYAERISRLGKQPAEK